MLLLAACHLFVPDPTIDCVKGQPCAEPDSAGDSDSGSSGPSPSIGWAIALEDEANPRARLYSAAGDMRHEWSDVTSASQVAWDEANGQGFLIGDSGAWYLAPDGSTEPIFDENIDVLVPDVAYFKKSVLITVAQEDGSGLYRLKDHSGSTEEIRSRTDGSYGGLATNADAARVLFLGDQPDVFEITAEFDLTIYSATYDSDTALSDALAIGADGGLYVCSSTGAVYSVRGLSEGDRVPVATTAEVVDDVVSCAWDGAMEAWLFGSLGTGVIRVDHAGTSEVIFSMPGGYTPMDVAFY